uniref:Uncharacterized protein n=1 Tax=Glossina austeni TaxID=7395 RepID=A0A1A9VBW2_GLOAU
MPTLPNIVLKAISLACFAGSVIMGSIDFVAIASVSESYCIVGNHVTDEIGFHLLLLRVIFIPDCIYAFCLLASLPFNACSFGAEPTTIVYNVLAGLLAQVSLSKLPTIEDCGNIAMPTILTVPKSNGSLIGILHFVNAGVCLIFLPVVEKKPQRTWPLPNDSIGCCTNRKESVYVSKCNSRTIGYNILAGMIAHSSLSKVTLIEDCGNEAMQVLLFQPAATVSLVGTLHYANAFVSVVFLARVESPVQLFARHLFKQMTSESFINLG